jgi:hypothetical protein
MIRRLANVTMIPLMPRTAAGLQTILDMLLAQTQARDAMSVEKHLVSTHAFLMRRDRRDTFQIRLR